LAAYLKSKNADEGYLLTFDFRETGDDYLAESKWVERDGKRIFDAVLRVGEEKKNRSNNRSRKQNLSS